MVGLFAMILAGSAYAQPKEGDLPIGTRTDLLKSASPMNLSVEMSSVTHEITDDNENNAGGGVADGDMDVYMDNDVSFHPVEFNIFIDETSLIGYTVQLQIYAYDVDRNVRFLFWNVGEYDDVYFNGTYLGRLNGSDNAWSLTTFNVDPSLVNLNNAKNTVQIVINTNGSAMSEWATSIDYGRLVLTPPQNPLALTCPGELTVANDEGLCSAVVEYDDPVPSGGTPPYTLALLSGQASGTTFAEGTTSNNWQVTDGTGATATCSFDVIVEDKEGPTFTCPGNKTYNLDANCQITIPAALLNSITNEADNCGGAVTMAMDPPAGTKLSMAHGETTTVTFTATDSEGNTTTCSITVTARDRRPPVITCPGDMTAENDPGECSAVVEFDLPTVTDNCLKAGVASNEDQPWTNNGQRGIMFDIENHSAQPLVVKSIRTAHYGNAETYFDVMVMDNPGSYVPNYFDASQWSVNTTIPVPAVSGLSFIDIELTTPLTLTPGEVRGVYITAPLGYPAGPVAYERAGYTGPNPFSDPAGLLFVRGGIGFSGYFSPDIFGEPGNATSFSTLYGNVVFDSHNVTLEQIGGLESGSEFPVGQTVNTFKATDAGGNTATCSFTVTVIDAEDPWIEPTDDQAYTTSEDDLGLYDCAYTGTVPLADFGDNCSAVLTWTITKPDLSTVSGTGQIGEFVYPKGVNTVDYVVTDPPGHTATDQFTVTVADDESPKIGACGATYIVTLKLTTLASGHQVWRGTLPQAKIKNTITDNCDNVADGSITVTFSQTIFTNQDWGTNTEWVKAVDSSGNPTQCNITVIVRYPLKSGEADLLAGVDGTVYQPLDVTFYPNPTQGDVKAKITYLNNPQVTAVVYNMAGAVVFQRQYITDGLIDIDLKGQVPGMYLLRLIADNNEFMGKIIKQ